MLQALSLNKPEYPYLLLGLLMAIAVGIIEPLFALVYSDMFNASSSSTCLIKFRMLKS